MKLPKPIPELDNQDVVAVLGRVYSLLLALQNEVAEEQNLASAMGTAREDTADDDELGAQTPSAEDAPA